MTESARHTNSYHKFAGIFEILVSAYWSFHNAETLYDYRAHPEILRAFIIPDWILIFHFLTGAIGIWSGIQIFRATWSIKKGYLTFLGLWAIGQIMYYVMTAF